MSRIVRLTESDLTRIVRRVIMEQKGTRMDPNKKETVTLVSGCPDAGNEIGIKTTTVSDSKGVLYYNCTTGVVTDNTGTKQNAGLGTYDKQYLSWWCKGGCNVG
jgi:hypothetical protein